MSETEYGKLNKCSDCGETMPPRGIHRCSPTYRQLKTQLAASQTEANDLRVRVEGLLLDMEGR